MAIVSVLCGGILGFFGFITAWLAFDATFLTAMIVYASLGFVTAALLLIAALRPATGTQRGLVQTIN